MRGTLIVALEQFLLGAGFVEEKDCDMDLRVFNAADAQLSLYEEVFLYKEPRSISLTVYFYPKRGTMFAVSPWSPGDIEKVRRALNEVAILGAL